MYFLLVLVLVQSKAVYISKASHLEWLFFAVLVALGLGFSLEGPLSTLLAFGQNNLQAIPDTLL